RHYIKRSSVERLVELAIPYLRNAGLLSYDETLDSETMAWVKRLVELLAPYVDRLDQLPERAASIFHYDAAAAIRAEDNRELLTSEIGQKVVDAFARQIQQAVQSNGALTPEHFKQIMNTVKSETGAKGRELFHPVRIVLTGSHSGPDFDRLI